MVDGCWRPQAAGGRSRGFNSWKATTPDYPQEALLADLDKVRSNLEKMRMDTATPDTRLSDDMNSINPAVTEALTQQMLGGLPTGRTGGPLHCRLRYFDPERRRAGIPEDLAALVENLSADSVTVVLVNTNQVAARTLTVQGGAYAEHQFRAVEVDGRTVDVGGSAFTVEIGPGCGARLRIGTDRYANSPTLAFPWRR